MRSILVLSLLLLLAFASGPAAAAGTAITTPSGAVLDDGSGNMQVNSLKLNNGPLVQPMSQFTTSGTTAIYGYNLGNIGSGASLTLNMPTGVTGATVVVAMNGGGSCTVSGPGPLFNGGVYTAGAWTFSVANNHVATFVYLGAWYVQSYD